MAVRFFRIRILAVASTSSVGGEGECAGTERRAERGAGAKDKKSNRKKKGLCNVGLVESVKPKLKNKKLGQLESIY
jgi:hypothetical protein